MPHSIFVVATENLVFNFERFIDDLNFILVGRLFFAVKQQPDSKIHIFTLMIFFTYLACPGFQRWQFEFALAGFRSG
jgi:hypothetical protein